MRHGMTNCSWHHTLTTMFLVTALLLGGASEGLHNHAVRAGGAAGPSIASHDCGEHEQHIPLNQLKQCPLCQQGGSRAAPSITADFDHQTPQAIILPVISAGEDLAQPHYYSSGKRGPPSA
jgi:hypothetical protein